MLRMMQVAAGLVLAAWTAGVAVADSNLMPNGDFNNVDQITGWTLFNDINAGILSWNSDDAGSDSNSGSMQLDTDSFGEPTKATSACLAVPAGGAVSAGGWSRVIAAGGFDYQFSFSCTIYASANCAAVDAILYLNPTASISASWTAMTADTKTLPGNSKSADCTVFEVNVYTAATAAVRFDALYVSADYIFHDGFE
jgi:hypothetical protein